MAAEPLFLITGETGQVGRALIAALAPIGRVVALDRAACDLSDPNSIVAAVRAVKPDIIVNAAAYTAVDKAEAQKDLACAVNAEAPATLAALAHESGAMLVHYSTDYVFDGRKPQPYVETDNPNPLSVYGASKLAGECSIRELLPSHLILRTSWVFGAHGTNFLKTILRLAQERDSLRVVSDQIGAPTEATAIARATVGLIKAMFDGQSDALFGTYHLTAAGETSWHGFARFIVEKANRMGAATRLVPDAIVPIPTAEYPTAAARPANSRLNTAKLCENFGISLPPWQDGAQEVLEALLLP